MNLNSKNFKLFIGIFYLLFLFIGLFFLFSAVDFKDLTNYDFIRSKSDIILKYKEKNFVLLSLGYLFFSILWVLLLGFASPILLVAGFVFGKWWGILIVLTGTTIGASSLYLLAKLFFRDFINQNIGPKFLKLKELFNKNDFVYFLLFRFVGGGGIPYAIQNVMPVIFDLPLKKYFAATFLGSGPSMFVSVALGAGIEKYIIENEKLNFFTVLSSKEIYLPILGFIAILLLSFFVKNVFFKNKIKNE